MRSSLKSIIAVAAALLVAPSFAVAEDGNDDLREVLSRVSDLEQQLRATNDALAAASARSDQQQQQLSRINDAPATGAMPALSSFLTETSFGGSIATSYFYNTRNPNSEYTQGANSGAIGALPHHSDSNQFKLDELWFSASNASTTESRGGFEFDILLGETAEQLCNVHGDEGNGTCVYTANISYLAPIGNDGVEIRAGRFATHIGSETPQSTANFNITRGLLWGLQPVNNTGVKASSSSANGFDWMVGVTNDAGLRLSNQNHDSDDEKNLIWHLGYKTSDNSDVAVNGSWGGDCNVSGIDGDCGETGEDEDKTGIVDVILNWDPSDNLSTWVNVDYIWASGENRDNGNPWIFGAAAAGRYQVTEDTGVALRAEYIYINDAYFGGVMSDPREELDLWSVTGTVDRALTDHVTVKAELVYQEGNSVQYPDNVFFQDKVGENTNTRQVILGAQMIYQF